MFKTVRPGPVFQGARTHLKLFETVRPGPVLPRGCNPSEMFKRLGSDHPRGWTVHADRPRERTVHADHPRGCTVRADHLRRWTVRADRPRGRTVHADRPRGRMVRAVCKRVSLPNSLNKSVRPNGTQSYHIDVVTHPLADFDFHEDRPHPLWFLMGSS